MASGIYVLLYLYIIFPYNDYSDILIPKEIINTTLENNYLYKIVNLGKCRYFHHFCFLLLKKKRLCPIDCVNSHKL